MSLSYIFVYRTCSATLLPSPFSPNVKFASSKEPGCGPFFGTVDKGPVRELTLQCFSELRMVE